MCHTLELTDGWYSLMASLDTPLNVLVSRGVITVGGKVLVCGAEIMGTLKPGHPLEVLV